MRCRRLRWFACASALCATSVAAQPLQPYQMIRSLQIIQDRIADGDHAALPMQRKLLEIIDQRFRDADPSEFGNDLNFRALFLYAMSGGNPTTVELLLSKLPAEDRKVDLGRGVVDYLKGAFTEARDELNDIDPMTLDPILGASVALVRGAVTTQADPKEAVRLFDQARLLSPGTLVEEAALRRSISVAATLGETERFTRSALQYVRRFLRSPYASQFAEAFVAGIVALHETIDLSRVEEVVSDMNREQARVIYLRLARKSAIEGYGDLLAFASTKAAEFIGGNEETTDPRAVLYSSIASVTSENVGRVVEKLGEIDRKRLSAQDRELLDAAKTIAREVLARPSVAAPDAPLVPENGEPFRELAALKPGGAAPQAVPADLGDPRIPPISPDDAEATSPTEAFVTATRDKLEEIDRLLDGDTP